MHSLVSAMRCLRQLPSSVKELYIDLQFLSVTFVGWSSLRDWLLPALPKGLDVVHIHLAATWESVEGFDWPVDLFTKTRFVFSIHGGCPDFWRLGRRYLAIRNLLIAGCCGDPCWSLKHYDTRIDAFMWSLFTVNTFVLIIICILLWYELSLLIVILFSSRVRNIYSSWCKMRAFTK